MNHLANLTAEEREAMLIRAREARLAKIAAWRAKEHLLEQDFGSDLTHWRRLARRFGVRLPAAYIPGVDGLKYVRRAIKKTGVDFVGACACGIKEMARINPTWPAYALVGLVLEQAYEEAGEPELPEDDTPEIDEEWLDGAELIDGEDDEDIQAAEPTVIRTLADVDDEDDLI